MKTVHITEDTLNGRAQARSFWIWMAVVWIWPLIVFLGTFHWHYPCVGLRLLCKSTWVLFAGMLQSWAVLLILLGDNWYTDRRGKVLIVLTVVSFFVLPFGLGRWEYQDGYIGSYGLSYHWTYVDNLFLSMIIHMLPAALIGGLSSGDYYPDHSSSYSSGSSFYRPSSGSGLWGERTWLDDVWKGGQVSDDYYGHRGEFDLNDEARRVSEDIQQFHRAHPDADLSDHYFWEDVLDAETDDFLDD